MLQALRQIQPDIICITGDMAQWNAFNPDVMRFLLELKAKYGVFAVLGDSDKSTGRSRCFYCHRPENVHLLRKKPVFLRNSSVIVRLSNGHNLEIVGISPDMKDEDFPQFWQSVMGQDQDVPVLVLSHFSRFWQMASGQRHILWLSGDTHGGQVWVPEFLWPLLFRGKDYRHLRGLFHSGKNKWLYVNPGIGTVREFPVRIGVPPETTVFIFRPPNENGSQH